MFKYLTFALLLALAAFAIFNFHSSQAPLQDFQNEGCPYVVSGSTDGTIKIWDNTTGSIYKTLEGHTGAVNSVSLSPDCSKIISGSSDKSVRIWGVKSGEQEYNMGTSDEVNKVLFLDDKTAASGGWDNEVTFWDVRSGQKISSTSVGICVMSIALSADKKYLATGNNWDGRLGGIKVFNYDTMSLVKEIQHIFVAESIVFSPDNKYMITAHSQGEVMVFDVEKKFELLHKIQAHEGWTFDVAVNKSSDRMITVGWDKEIHIYEIESGEKKLTAKDTSEVHSVAISRDSKYFATGNHEGSVKVWGIDTASLVVELKGHKNEVKSVAFGDSE